MAQQTAPKKQPSTTNGSVAATSGLPVQPTPAERATRGRAARSRASRSAQAAWQPPADRADPVEILRGEEATRVPEPVPIRHGRMLVSPFTFYRGAAAVMAADLAATPTTGLLVQLCGDARLSNFGGFASPERELVFDVNDFDETAPGPFEWDVKRLAASIEIAARERSRQCRHALQDHPDARAGPQRSAVLRVKEATESVLEPFAGTSRFVNHGRRVSGLAEPEPVPANRRMRVSGQDFCHLTARAVG